MENKAISLDGWEFIDLKGHSAASTIAINSLQIGGYNGHDAILQKTIMVPRATNVLLSALSHRSHPKLSDVRVGLSAQFGHWAGRDFTTATSVYLLNEHEGGLLTLELQFGGEWGSHTCQFRDIQLSYEPVSGPEPEPPATGVAGQIAQLHKEVREFIELAIPYLEQIEIRVRKADALFDQEQFARDWIDKYNRSLDD